MEKELPPAPPPLTVAEPAERASDDDVRMENTSERHTAQKRPTGGQECQALLTAELQLERRPGQRIKKPTIDLDDAILRARTALKEAQKKVAAAKAEARNEKRRKQRLLRKASSLSVADLERIQVLKRCGFVAEDQVAAAALADTDSEEGQSSAASSSKQSAGSR